MKGLREFPGLVRHGAIDIDTRGKWLGEWNWPIRIATASAANDRRLLASLRDTAAVKRGHASIEAYVPGSQPDLLIFDGVTDLARYGALSKRIGALMLAGDDVPLDLDKLASLRRKIGAGLTLGLHTPEVDIKKFLEELLNELSHDRTFEDAIDRSLSWQSSDARSGVAAVAAPEFLIRSRLSSAIGSMIENARTVRGSPISIPAIAVNQFDLRDGFNEPRPANEVADALRGGVGNLSFNMEREGATGAAAVSRAISDAKSGPELRFPDALLYRGDRVLPENRLSSGTVLGIDETYILDFAFRSQRFGIGFDTNPRSLVAEVDEPTELLVAISAGPGSEAEISEPVQKILIAPAGDTKSARFLFKPKSARDDRLLIEIRVYGGLNLVEYVVLQADVDTYERDYPAGTIAQRMQQPERFRRYEGALSQAQPPAGLSVDVTVSGAQYNLTFASSVDKALKLSVRSALTRDDLKRQLGQIRDLWLDIGGEVFVEGLAASSDYSGSQALRNLAQSGQALWQLLFDAGPPTGSARALRDALRAKPLPDGAKISIRLASEAREFVFPWQLLYDRDIPARGAVDTMGFWGARYHVEQQLSVAMPRGERAPSPTDVGMSIFVDGTFSQLASQRTLTDEMKAASGGRLKPEFYDKQRELEERLKAGTDLLLYFFCHGLSAVPYSDWAAELQVAVEKRAKTSETMRSLNELIKGSAKLDGSDTSLKLTASIVKLGDLLPLSSTFLYDPIVFLNMCESAQLFPDASRSFVSFFLNRFAAAVIGTECPVPPAFGEAMALYVLPRILSGQPIGPVLLQARQTMLSRYGNPIGLAYALWGDTYTTLDPTALDSVACMPFFNPEEAVRKGVAT